MSEIVKFRDSIQFEDDLNSPTLGNVIKDDTILMGTWASLAIGSFLYLQPFGLISLIALAYLGYRDVRATSKKQADNDAKEEKHELAQAIIEQEEETLISKFEKLQTELQYADKPVIEIEPQFVDNPWVKKNLGKYEGDVYASPEDKANDQVAQARFRAPNVSELLQLPIAERAESLLESLALSGCDLRDLLHDSIVAVTGEQQSGKSTLLVILSIFETALLDKKVHYATTDSDVYPFKFASVVDSVEGYRDEVKTVSQLTKGKASDQSWLFDELTRQDRETISQPLWNQLLTGFVKTRAHARLVIHGKTLPAMGVPNGFNEQAKQEATILRAKRMSETVAVSERRKLAHGGRYPSGQYTYLEMDSDNKLSDSKDTLTLPDWLQFELNDEGLPCYVRSVLAYFPELQGQVEPRSYQTVAAVPVADNSIDSARQQLTALWEGATTIAHPSKDEIDLEEKEICENTERFAYVVVKYLSDRQLNKTTLAQLLANCYELKKHLKLNSHDENIRAKGRETAKILTKKAGKLNLLKIEERGQSINIWPPDEPLFGVAR